MGSYTSIEGSRSLDPVDEDAGVKVDQHGIRSLTLGGWQWSSPQLFAAPLVFLVFLLTGLLFGLHLLQSPPLVSPSPLVLPDFIHHFHQPSLSLGRKGKRPDGHLHPPGRQV